MYARDPGHCGHGAVHGNEGFVYEKRARIRVSVLDHGTVDVQRPAGSTGANPAGERQGRRTYGTRGQQVRPGGGTRGRQGAGRQLGTPLQLRLHGDLREGQNQRQRRILRSSATDQ